MGDPAPDGPARAGRRWPVVAVIAVAVAGAVAVVVAAWPHDPGMRVRWVATTFGPVVAPPLLAGDRLYAASTDGTVRCLDRESGRELWVSTAPRLAVHCGMALAGDTLYCCSDANLVVALSASDGSVRWEHKTRGPMQSAPVVYGGRVFAAGDDGILRVLSAKTGVLERYCRRPSYVAADLAVSPTGILAMGCGDGFLYLIDLTQPSARALNGEWTPEEKKAEAQAAIHGDPVVDGSRLLFGSDDGRLHCVDLRTAQVLGDTVVSDAVRGSPCIDEQTAYFGANDGCLYAADVTTGYVLWRRQCGGAVRSRPVLLRGVLYFASDDGSLWAVAPRDQGRVLGCLRFGSAISGGLVGEGNRLYFGCDDGAVRCVESFLPRS